MNSALPDECLGIIIWWRESGEVLSSEFNNEVRGILYRTFWENESNQATFYRQYDDMRVLFRAKIRGKFVIGLGKGKTESLPSPTHTLFRKKVAGGGTLKSFLTFQKFIQRK